MTKLDLVFNPVSIGNMFGTRRCIRFDVVTGSDITSIGYLDRNYNYTVIDFIPNGNPRKIKTEETETSFVLANDIDTFKIRHIVTDDEYLVWNEIEKALSVSDVASIHDIDGFTKLIPINNLSLGKYRNGYSKPRMRRNSGDTEAVVYIYHTNNQSESSSDFADAIALQCQIITDRVSVVHCGEYGTFVDNIPAELIQMMAVVYKQFQKKNTFIRMIADRYSTILIIPNCDQFDFEF